MRWLPLFLLLLTLPAAAQPVDAPAPRVVMNLAAHPDDEDGATMAYYRYAKDAVVHSVIFTRGEGGQNEIGPELYEALGAIRTDETERAARHLGTQVHFLNFEDFGYSKTASEAFERWGGRDRVTARLVYLIRSLKPDVLFTNHDTTTVGPRRQHGHHQAVGIAAYDAFALAADPAYHPEQLDEEGVDLWQPKRLFLRHFLAEARHDVSVPVGAVYAPEGRSYAALAADALGEHASQGMDQFAERIRRLDATHFELIRSATDAPLGPDDLAANLPPHPAPPVSISYLIDAGRIDPLPDGAFTVSTAVAVPGQPIRLAWDRSRLPALPVRLALSGALDTTLTLAADVPGVAALRLPVEAVPTTPAPVYQYRRFASNPPVWYAVYGAEDGALRAAGYLALEVAPPLHVEITEPVVRLHAGANRLPVRAQVFDPAATHLTLAVAVSRDADRTVIHQEQMPV
ncbi:MAG: PIG-L family deacetylase, partial [Rhodothermales bacterium]|nr:PIG-L family deacetylase [Rhodothermales bacterium]